MQTVKSVDFKGQGGFESLKTGRKFRIQKYPIVLPTEYTNAQKLREYNVFN